MICRLEKPQAAASLFAGWNETLIWSCLENVMGSIYADSDENPVSAMAVLGDFSFFAGIPDEELVMHKPEGENQELMIMVPQNKIWSELIEKCYPQKAKKVIRYAFRKKMRIFDQAYLQNRINALSDEYCIKMIDEDLFYRCKDTLWCRDWVSQYTNYEMYQNYGLGAVILKDNEIVSGASSYSSYLEGIEIQIDTKDTYRRKGLAFVCGAKLILECLKRDLEPSWDAQNKESAELAGKLGYQFDYKYEAYEIWRR